MEPMVNFAAESCSTCGSPLLSTAGACEQCEGAVNLPEPHSPGEASVPESLVGGLLGGIVVLGGLLFVIASFLGLAAILFGGGN